MGAPFVRGRFEELPELPRVPHPYGRTTARDVSVHSKHFGDVRIHLREHGNGPPLLLVHGLMTTSYSYRYVLERLGQKHRLLIPDLPGCGQSDKPDTTYGPAALATFLGEFVDALGIRGCVTVGNSMGGYLCMRAVLRDPTIFSKLVNVHSPAFPELRLRAMNALLQVPGVAAGLSAFVQRDVLRWAHRNVHYFDESLKSLEEAHAYGDPLATPEGMRAFTRYLRDAMSALGLAEFSSELQQRKVQNLPFPIPLCLIYARHDPLVPASVGARLAPLVPDAQLHWLEDTSHFAHVDTPGPVADLVEMFFAS
ncbi:MAG: alpha/beta hydrolase [Deltaproteobacteria bacterium]|nr:alpha/beta hydrolase [Deltaproteobacteria bacterium]